MIVILKSNCTKDQMEEIESLITSYGLGIHKSVGESQTIMGLIGDVRVVSSDRLMSFAGVDNVLSVSTPYKMAGRHFHPEDTVINVKGVKIGGDHFAVFAGPCSIESEDQIVEIAKSVKKSGANILRGGAYKPRTSPYSFQGMGLEGLKLLGKAGEITNMPVVTEVMSTDAIDAVCEYADIIQIGTRNMQNFDLLKAVGKTDKPVLLKRGLSAKVEELLMSAEYIMSEGNQQVILCERGIRTFETTTRNTLDISAIPVIKKLSHLPVIADPSHATGKWWLVESMAKSAVVAGAHGIMTEVHNDPKKALCDGEESIKPELFDELMKKIKVLAEIENMIIS